MFKIIPVRNYLKALYAEKVPKNNYYIFDISYTKKEMACLENLKIKKDLDFNYYGCIDDQFGDKLNTFIDNTITPSSDVKTLNALIHKISNNVTKAYNQKYCWVLIRATLPNKKYDIPRWHQDGNVFIDMDKFNIPEKDPKLTKFITTLKGQGTLFIKKTKKVDDLYKKFIIDRRAARRKLLNDPNYKNTTYNHQSFENRYREQLAEDLKCVKYQQLQQNQGLIFYCNTLPDQARYGLLHSEPKHDTQRLFISIITGSQSDIESLKKRYE
jgi:hypothetical protein